MNYSTDEMVLGSEWYRRRARVFFVLAIVFSALTISGIFLVITNADDRGANMTGTIQVAVIAGVFLILWIGMLLAGKNPRLVSKRGIKLAAIVKESVPDFEATGEFVIRPYDKRSPKVWVNRDFGQIQFLLPSLDPAYPRKKERLVKTKCLQMTSLLGIELKVARETITQFGGYGINPLEKTVLVAGGGTKSTRTVGYYAVDFLFDDLDLPFVSLSFNRDSEGAKRLFYAIRTLAARNGGQEK